MNTIRTMRSNFQGNTKAVLKTSLLLAASALFSGTATAHCTSEKLYAGAGLTFNSVKDYTNDARGYQIFGGYCLDIHKQNPRLIGSLELGYMNSGDFKREVLIRQRNNTFYPVTISTSYEGLWVNLVGEYKLDPRVHLLGRIGVDGGDDEGVMAGFGVGLNFSKWAQFRIEYVARERINSTQISWLTGF